MLGLVIAFSDSELGSSSGELINLSSLSLDVNLLLDLIKQSSTSAMKSVMSSSNSF